MQYNPSFAGQAGGPRISSNVVYSNYDAAKSQRVYSHLSYDQFIPAIRSGIGITAGYFNSIHKLPHNLYGPGTSGLSYDKVTFSGASFTVAIAPKISLKGKYTISPSIDFSYGIAEEKVTLSEVPVVDTIRGGDGKQYGINSRAGILFNTNKLYVGYKVVVLRRSILNSTYNPLSSYRPVNIFESFLQAGYTFQKSSESKFSFTPQVVIQISKYDSKARLYYGLEAYNLNFRYKHFIWGVNDSDIRDVRFRDRQLFTNGGIHIGWQTDKLRVMLTNNYGFNSQYESSRYVGNLSFRYIFSSKHQRPGRNW